MSTTNTQPEAKKAKKVVQPIPTIEGSEVVGATRWLTLSSLSYKDRYGDIRGWDMVARSTKKTESYADAVVILSILKGGDLKEPHIVLVKQFRPPLGAFAIEMPAGLIDPGETPEKAAMREMYEECGYVGKVIGQLSPELNLSPGLSNETAAVVHLEIDLDAPENKNPKQKLEDGEDIEVIITPVSTLTAKLNELDKEGCGIFFGLYSFALAISMSKSILG
eukprot:m.35187 g.35187  ORF g.35187 m.35187 type:complete len:221 (-) comp17098_c0_seq1:48-710(-)